MTYIATTLAYVRTPAGVAHITPGDRLPANADIADVQRLVAAGAAAKTRTRKPKNDDS